MEIEPDTNAAVVKKYNGNYIPPAYADEKWWNTYGHDSRIVGQAVALDIETTGLVREEDQLIEIAIRTVWFHRFNGDIVRVSSIPYVALQEHVPLSQTVRDLTGLCDADLKDQSIDWERVNKELLGAEFVFSHHAAFDRWFVKKAFPNLRSIPWACSLEHVDWDKKNIFCCKKLKSLCRGVGFYVDGHRALNDVDAMIYLLSKKLKSDKTLLYEMMHKALQPAVWVLAAHSDFECKQALKDRGYRWNEPVPKVWQKQICIQDRLLETEILWLQQNVYHGPFRGEIRQIEW